MSRNPSDASPDARREEAVTRRLGEAFGALAAPPGGQCLDAEQIAAYQQRALAPEEAEQCEAHFAACSHCREVLVLLAAAEDAAMADHQAAAAVAAAAQPSRPRAWRLLWLVPAAAAASVALWLMVQPFSHTMVRSPQSSTPPLVAEAPPPEQLTAPNQSLGAPSEREAPAPSAGRDESPAAPPPPGGAGIAGSAPVNSYPDSGSVSAAKSGVSPTSVAPSASANIAEQSEAQTTTPAAAAPAPAAPPTPAATTESAANTAPASPQATPDIRAMSRLAAPSPPARPGGQAPASSAAPQASAGAAQDRLARAPAIAGGLFAPAPAAFGVQLRSPSGAVSWRAGAAGRIERSTDGGRTWQAQASPFAEDWLAGSVVSDTICWLVGRNGTIARTTDGEHWLRVPPPPAANTVSGKLPDWTSVTAGGAGTALVGSATGKFVTRDAGNAWQPQP